MKVTHSDLTTDNVKLQSGELRLKTAVILSYTPNCFGLLILVLIHLIAVYLVCTPSCKWTRSIATHSTEDSYISGSNSFSSKEQYCCFQEPVTLGVTYFSQEEIDSSLLFISIVILIFFKKPTGQITSNTVSHLCGSLLSLCANPAFVSLFPSCSYASSGCKIKSCICSLQRVSL